MKGYLGVDYLDVISFTFNKPFLPFTENRFYDKLVVLSFLLTLCY